MLQPWAGLLTDPAEIPSPQQQELPQTSPRAAGRCIPLRPCHSAAAVSPRCRHVTLLRPCDVCSASRASREPLCHVMCELRFMMYAAWQPIHQPLRSSLRPLRPTHTQILATLCGQPPRGPLVIVRSAFPGHSLASFAANAHPVPCGSLRPARADCSCRPRPI